MSPELKNVTWKNIVKQQDNPSGAFSQNSTFKYGKIAKLSIK